MFERLTEKARETLHLEPQLHLEGNRGLVVENCERIEEYNEVFMRLISGGLCINIWGSGLRACDFGAKGLCVSGRIFEIELIERSSEKNEGSAEGMRQDQRQR